MRVAIVGLGEIARKAYLPMLAEQAGLDLMLSSRSESSVHQVQAQYRIQSGATDLTELIRNRPDVAFVLTPKETHFEIVRQLLNADVDVFVEKPATLHSDETEQLAELAERRGRILMIAFNRRFAPLHLKAKDMLAGRPVSVGLFQKHRKNTVVGSLPEQLIEDSIHQVDLVRFYCGEGHAISTVEEMHDGRLLGTISTIALDSGGLAAVAISLNAGAWSETYALHGADQSVLIDAFLRLRQVTPTNEKSWQETYASGWKTILEGRGFRGQMDHFFERVRNRTEPLTSAWDSVKTQRLLEELVRVAKTTGEGPVVAG
jgi:virulence factor